MRRHGELGLTQMLPKKLLSLTATTTLWTHSESYYSSGTHNCSICLLGGGVICSVVGVICSGSVVICTVVVVVVVE